MSLSTDNISGLMAGKRGLIMGVANDKSIAWGIARAAAAAGAEVVIDQHPVTIGQSWQLGGPVISGPAKPGTQHDGLTVGRAMAFPVEWACGASHHLPTCAILAISTRASGLTRPH